ncbi:procollagen galactosyltransferase 2-like [Bolinopsis microptera]|uniref:procollagen galactosyltransferase 2-like n=1 Tax=Bolinopsis microptera TaxID=2820187 RepID=UPI00307A423A
MCVRLAPLLLLSILHPTPSYTEEASSHPTVLLAILARSRAHILPTWLGFIENLNYPKSSLAVYIQTDHNQDNTPLMLSEWSDSARSVYHDITLNTLAQIAYTQSLGPTSWDDERYIHMMKIRQNVLDHARKNSLRYVFFVDTDNFITNPETLNVLLSREKTIVGPMLRVTNEVAYSNYWAGMTMGGYYKSIPEYKEILRQTKLGAHPVPMVHSTLLIDLHGENADKLKYYPIDKSYSGPIDDIIHFALNAKAAGVPMFIDNEHTYGYMLTRGEYNTVSEEIVGWQEYYADTLLLRMGVEHFPKSVHLQNKRPAPSKLGFDEVYMINLERRPERRKRMLALFDMMGIDARVFNAVDGKKLDDEKLKEMKVKQLDGYQDPYLMRPLKLGEIGCFLSHYYIWEEVVAKNYKQVVVLEDDVRFKPNFKSNLAAMMREVDDLGLDWDLIYLARKILYHSKEKWVPLSSRLVLPDYSYWTAGYLVSQSGAKKLLRQEPLTKMMAVDEYLPLMFNKHPNKEWSSNFVPRDLKAYSASPLLAEPQFYIGQTGYLSDTETSEIIDPEVLAQQEKDAAAAKQEL